MRAFALLVSIAVAVTASEVTAGQHIDFRFALPEGVADEAATKKPKSDCGPFSADWSTLGVEQAEENVGRCELGWPVTKVPSPAPIPNLFAEMWTTRAFCYRDSTGIDRSHGIETVSFDENWLSDSLWARTQQLLGSRGTEPVFTFGGIALQR